MADGQEESVDGQVVERFVGFSLALDKVDTLHAVLSIESYGIVLEQDFDFGIIGHALLHDVGGTQVVLSDNHVDFRTKLGQIGGLFACGVASANHGHDLLAVKESVAGGTGRDALTIVLLLVFQTEIFG